MMIETIIQLLQGLIALFEVGDFLIARFDLFIVCGDFFITLLNF